MRKRWLIIPVVVLALAIAIAGGVVMARGASDGTADNDDSGVSSGSDKGFAARVAEILDLEEDTVSDAIKQAMQEMHDERVQAWLDRMVESGRITQDQADEYKTWLDSKPEGIQGMRGKGFGRHHGFRGKGFNCDKDGDTSDSDASTTESTST